MVGQGDAVAKQQVSVWVSGKPPAALGRGTQALAPSPKGSTSASGSYRTETESLSSLCSVHLAFPHSEMASGIGQVYKDAGGHSSLPWDPSHPSHQLLALAPTGNPYETGEGSGVL